MMLGLQGRGSDLSDRDASGSQRRTAGRKAQRLLMTLLAAVDGVAILLAVGLAGILRVSLDAVLPLANLAASATERHAFASLLVVPVLLLMFQFRGLYDLDQILNGAQEYARVAHAATYGVVVALAMSYFAGGGPLVSRSWILLVWTLTIASVGLGRFVVRRVVRHLRLRGALRTRVVIIGASNFGVSIAERLRSARGEGLDVIGFLDEYAPLGHPLLGDICVVGRPSDLIRGSLAECADEFILIPQAIPHERAEAITRLMISPDGPRLRMAVQSGDALTHGVLIFERAGVPLVTVQRARITGIEAVLKRSLDIIGALLALAAFTPLLVLTVVRGVLQGRPPRLERSLVYGTGGKQATLWLLSSDAERRLPVRGLPSLVSVLAGQFSLVGPRPIPWNEAASVPAPLWLTAVKPGLTGPWRLSGPNAGLEEQAVQDLTYVRNYTIWEDLRILLESLRRLRGGRLTPLLSRWQMSQPEWPPVPVGTLVSPGRMN